MSFSESEVPTVVSLLCSSLKADQTLRGPAVDILSNYERRPGFCSQLMDIISAKGPPSHDDVRLLASAYFKNTVKRYWGNSLIISKYEKTNLRNKLLSQLQEENNQIAEMLANIISKIARIDYPRKWPELFSVLTEQLKAADILTSCRIFEILSRIILKLARNKFAAEGTCLAEISSHFFDYCWELWKKDKKTIYYNFSFSQTSAINSLVEQQLHLTCERWLLCSSIVRELLILGFLGDAEYVKVLPVKDVCREFISAVESIIPYYSNFQAHRKLLFINRTCFNLMKSLDQIRHWNPNSFGDETVLEPILKFCLDKIMNHEHENPPLSERLLINCMAMVKSVLESIQYSFPSLNKRRSLTEDVKRNICNVVESLLPSDRAQDLCKILITRYFLLTENDLEEWSQDPERFYNEQTRNEDKLRPVAEALYIVLFKRYRQLLGPFVISILHEATNDRPAKETDRRSDMLLREAAYTAVEHACYMLSDKLNLNDLFKGVLCPELYNDHPDMHVIHRKIAYILQLWALKEKGDMRKPIFCALLRLLTYKDLVVRMAACQSLRFLVEEIDFQEKEYLDLLPTCWGLFFKLLEDVEEFESQDLVLDCLISMIKYIGVEIIPFANKLVDVLKKALKESTGDSVLHSEVLRVRKKFVNEFRIHSPICYNIFWHKEKKKRNKWSSLISSERKGKERKRMSKEKVCASHLLIKHQGSWKLSSSRNPNGSIVKNTTRMAAVSQSRARREDIVLGRANFGKTIARCSNCTSSMRGDDLDAESF